MPRVIVVNENGTMTWDERVTAADFETEHFQRCVAERLGWAVADAERAAEGPMSIVCRQTGTAPEAEMSAPLARGA